MAQMITARTIQFVLSGFAVHLPSHFARSFKNHSYGYGFCRIGRTARLGATGEAISFACENYAFHLPEIEAFIGYPIPMVHTDQELLPRIKRAPPAPRRHGRDGGKRHSHKSRGRRGR